MSNYDEVRFIIYNLLDALPESERDEIGKRLGWLESIVEQRERNRIIFLLRQGHSIHEFTKAWTFMADYLEAWNEDAERQEQEYGPG